MNWIELPPVEVPPELAAAVGGHPLVAQALARRGLLDPAAACAFLDPYLYQPAPPETMPGLAEAMDLVAAAILDGEPILVWGDFDVDGQTSTALLVATLRELGGLVSYHIPVRAQESHGVGLPVLKELLKAQGIRLLLTCDTGITAHEALEYAHRLGVKVVVTDHHELGERLPAVDAVANPHLLAPGGPGWSLRSLPGVGVAYKLAEALYARLGRTVDVEAHLDLAALGIVADVAYLEGDTRYLLQRGLQRLRTSPRLGLQTMMELAGLEPAFLSEEHLGFSLAPRLNALGRLGDANPAVELLTTGDAGRARTLAYELEGLNLRRRQFTNDVFQGALKQIQADPALLDSPVLVLAHPAWPAGIVGIVASRLVERFGRPVVLFSAPAGQLARGSARSVPGVDITAAIAAQASLLHGFGGHSMAAGLALDAERLPEFARRLARTLSEAGIPPQPGLAIEAALPLGELSMELAAGLERLAPFGPGNPGLVFTAHQLKVEGARTLGRDEEHRLVTVASASGESYRVVWWGGAGWPLPEGAFDLAYRVRAVTFRGQRDLQIEWVEARPAAEPASGAVEGRPPVIVQDERRNLFPLPALQGLYTAEPGLQIWCEGSGQKRLLEAGLPACDRTTLVPGRVLAVYTIPPGRSELQAVLDAVRPQQVFLFGVDPLADAPQPFLARLAGLVKWALAHRAGEVSLAQLAAATAQRESTVRLGLDWLEARGHVVRASASDGRRVYAPGDEQVKRDVNACSQRLQAVLDEAAAYRAYYMSASLSAVI